MTAVWNAFILSHCGADRVPEHFKRRDRSSSLSGVAEKHGARPLPAGTAPPPEPRLRGQVRVGSLGRNGRGVTGDISETRALRASLGRLDPLDTPSPAPKARQEPALTASKSLTGIERIALTRPGLRRVSQDPAAARSPERTGPAPWHRHPHSFN
ncbi:hypothetical protein SKAU_G00128540 [Synaphobranchus kaupii]|uniref:Uncharacterized protein n=1 Tax=Synaphobranchus kaupii TaxID=118154 RepID=A0A9Q1J343_SYNKA|nr:hypothetical protein SKAU_G00128540 [Synaphobranchus kaupii]